MSLRHSGQAFVVGAGHAELPRGHMDDGRLLTAQEHETEEATV